MEKISKKTEQANQDEGKLIKIEVADPAEGHQTLMLKPKEAQDFLSSQSDQWIFVDDEFTQKENLDLVDWNTTETVRVLPGMIGGMNNNESNR
jgi:hypothetical protein